MMFTIKQNEQYNSREVFFDAKPEANVIEALKALKMRWNCKKACWYGFATMEQLEAAIDGQKIAQDVCKPIKKEKSIERKHNVKVGDIFYTSWGYEQTNVNFFQVIELRGASSVVAREVHPALEEEEGVSGMSANRAYQVPSEILPPSSSSCFIEDNEKGKLCRVVNGYYGPCFKVGKPGSYQETAYPYTGQKLYESWYY